MSAKKKNKSDRGQQTVLEPTVTERRRLTRNSIYQLIFRAGEPVSKQQISSALGLSLPTIHQNIAELLEAGLIRVGEIKRSTGGRPPIGYEIDPNVKFSIAAAVTSNHFRLWAGNLRQEELAYKSVPAPNCMQDDISTERLKDEIDRFIEENHLDRSKLLGVGITVPGIFDEKSDQIVVSPTLKMKNFSMRSLVENGDYPIAVLNDSLSAGMEELIERQRRKESLNFVCLFLENGIGGAVFIDGKPFRGLNGRSGEFGHMRMVPGGRRCSCGQKGCLEAYCSAYRFTRDLGLSVEEFFAQVRQEKGGGPRTDLLNEVLHYLAEGIINLRMAFDCDIVLEGFLTEYLGPYMDGLREELEKLDPFSDSAAYLKVAGSPKASFQGATWAFTEKFVDGI